MLKEEEGPPGLEKKGILARGNLASLAPGPPKGPVFTEPWPRVG